MLGNGMALLQCGNAEGWSCFSWQPAHSKQKGLFWGQHEVPDSSLAAESVQGGQAPCE